MTTTTIAPTRSKPVCVRFTPDEYAEIAAVAEAKGCTVPDLLRSGWTWLQYADAIATQRDELRSNDPTPTTAQEGT